VVHMFQLASDLQQASRGGSALFNATKGPTGVIKSVLDTTRTDGGRRDEIFVDIVEKLTCTFNSSGYLQASQIDGAIVVSSPLLRFTPSFSAVTYCCPAKRGVISSDCIAV